MPPDPSRLSVLVYTFNFQPYHFIPASSGPVRSLQPTEDIDARLTNTLTEVISNVPDWYTLGRKLGLPDDLLNKLESGAYGTDRQKHVVITWLVRNAKISADVLNEIGEYKAAKESWNKHVPGNSSKFARVTRGTVE